VPTPPVNIARKVKSAPGETSSEEVLSVLANDWISGGATVEKVRVRTTYGRFRKVLLFAPECAETKAVKVNVVPVAGTLTKTDPPDVKFALV